MSPPQSQPHPHPDPLHTLAPHLLPHLPYSLPLLRRLQYHRSSPSAHTFATFPADQTPPPLRFSATYVDRSRAPETECWIFSTYEVPLSPSEVQQHDAAWHDRRREEARAQILALLRAIADLKDGGALMILGSLNEILVELLAGENMETLAPQKVLTRSIDEATEACNSSTQQTTGRGVLNGLSVPYMKWLIAPPSPAQSNESQHLPEGYVFDRVRREELALTMKRTEIPKTEETLAQLGNIGIRYTDSAQQQSSPDGMDEGELTAWAFIGVDGSLSSLHVEPEHRGKGLAKAVCRRLFGMLAEDPMGTGFRAVGGMGKGGEGVGVNPELGWASSDVALENLESAGVARGLGGREGWRVRWVSVDLSRVERMVEDVGGGEVVGL